MSKIMQRWEEVSKTATEPDLKRWTNSDIAKFHYFNPNGIAAKKRTMDECISQAHKDGRCLSGAIIAYGSFNHFSLDKLSHLAMLKKVKWIRLSVTINMMEEDLRAAENFLATLPQKENN